MRHTRCQGLSAVILQHNKLIGYWRELTTIVRIKQIVRIPRATSIKRLKWFCAENLRKNRLADLFTGKVMCARPGRSVRWCKRTIRVMTVFTVRKLPQTTDISSKGFWEPHLEGDLMHQSWDICLPIKLIIKRTSRINEHFEHLKNVKQLIKILYYFSISKWDEKNTLLLNQIN